MGGGMGGHHGSGGKGRHADENSAGAPVPPMRYRLLGSLGWETDSLGSRSVNKLDTASPMRIPIAQLRLVDESTGRAVWKQAVKIDSMSMPMGTCPQAAQWNRLAGKASDQALSGMFGTKAP